MGVKIDTDIGAKTQRTSLQKDVNVLTACLHKTAQII
jgi:hypothetical protein